MAETKRLGSVEKQPVDKSRPDGMRSQEDRRVEVLLFDKGEEPDLGATNGEDVYDGVTYERKPVEPMLSALPWRAEWEDEETPAKMGDVRKMILEAPGLPAGEPAVFLTYQMVQGGNEALTSTKASTLDADSADEPFVGWYNADLVQTTSKNSLPIVSFVFAVSAGGRVIRSKPLVYADDLDVSFAYNGTTEPAGKCDYRLLTPWGTVDGKTDDKGRVVHKQLPPGGARVVVRDYRLVVEQSGAS